jgi:TonB family protein
MSTFRLKLLACAAFALMADVGVAAENQYLSTHQEANSRFLTSIERVGSCQVKTPPEVGGIRVPWQLYPQESVDNHEEGSVIVELIFDADWCVRKATIVHSTKYWRLDNVTLAYLMTVKFRPKPERIKQKDGEPTIEVKIGWGASQGRTNFRRVAERNHCG